MALGFRRWNHQSGHQSGNNFSLPDYSMRALTVSNAYNSSTFCLPVNLEDGEFRSIQQRGICFSASFSPAQPQPGQCIRAVVGQAYRFDPTPTLFDSKGMVVQTHQIPSGQQQVEMDIQALPNGIYWIRSGAANGYSEFKKLVVLH
ncbi:MAG: T9SS type A sorting domain-containing protein [Saprospiraceae bacterium]